MGRQAGEWRGLFQARGETRSQADMLIAATAVVVHVYRDVDLIRIISARKGDSRERRQYRGEL